MARRRNNDYDDYDDYSYDDDYNDRPRPRGFRCLYCGSRDAPTTRSKVSTSGWVVFVLLFFFCIPLCWIGLLMKERYRICYECGTKIGG